MAKTQVQFELFEKKKIIAQLKMCYKLSDHSLNCKSTPETELDLHILANQQWIMQALIHLLEN